jgi:putative acetyltransferase
MTFEVRPERSGDESAIGAVTDLAFAGAEHASGTEARIVEALRDRAQLTVSLVAERDAEVVGHVAISPVTVAPPDGTRVAGWYGLGPVSVHPDHQRGGIGATLVRQALTWIPNAQGCVVLGDPGYYGRFGFREHERLVLPDVPPAHFQALPIAAWEVPGGTVAYDEAFSVT